MSKVYKISMGLFKDFVIQPIRTFLYLDTVRKVVTIDVSEKSGMRKRFDSYLGYREKHMKLDEDIWKRWQDARILKAKKNGDWKWLKERYDMDTGLEGRGRGDV
jgi:hypothetical protein